MAALVISAPYYKSKGGNDYKSFDEILRTRIGRDYCIDKNLYSRIAGVGKCKLVLLDKDMGRRAEGTLCALQEKPGQKTANNKQLYNVQIDSDLKEVNWIEPPERLNRCGVALIE